MLCIYFTVHSTLSNVLSADYDAGQIQFILGTAQSLCLSATQVAQQVVVTLLARLLILRLVLALQR
jgi:hypothetical protein